nr:tRNA modification GTPase MnmE [Tanacetum cinerariifolium]
CDAVAMGADVVTMTGTAIDGWITEDNILLDRITHSKSEGGIG